MPAIKRSREADGGAGGAPGSAPKAPKQHTEREKKLVHLNEKLIAFFVIDEDGVGLGFNSGVGQRNEANSSYNAKPLSRLFITEGKFPPFLVCPRVSCPTFAEIFAETLPQAVDLLLQRFRRAGNLEI